MKRVFTSIAVIFIASLGFCPVNGQTTIDAEFRPRTEFREGYRKPLSDTLNPAFVTSQRTRFNADYKSKILNARISLEDSRIWGNTDLKSNSTKTAIYEAWFEYLITSGLSLQMGRQPLKYDDNRLFSSPAWSNSGMAHDVLVLKYKSPRITIHSGFAYNNSKDTLMNVAYTYNPKQNYKALGYFWMSKQIYKGTTLSVIGICDGFESKIDYQTVYPRITYGGNLVYANDSSLWGGKFTGYWQQGKDPNKALGNGYADLKSYFFATKASYKISKNYSTNVGLDYHSGSDATLDGGKSNTFNRLYGTVHNFNGTMDYFVSLPAQGLVDYYGGLTAKLTSKLSVDVDAHFFYFDKDFYYQSVITNKSLGQELDITLQYKVSKEMVIEGGYSHYFNSETTKMYFKMNGVETHAQQWAYVMFAVKPQFYKTPQLPESK